MKPPLLFLVGMLIVLDCLWFSHFNSAFAIENKSRVISPYWQSDSTSYTFVAVSHSSLSTIASQVGVVVNAIQNDLSNFGTALTFTISGGSTERIFIVRTNHPIVNPTNISSAKFIAGTTNFKHGHLLMEPVATNPSVLFRSTTKLINNGRRDVTMLSFWGAVVIESNTTGFAMEFIGDMQDSAATTIMHDSATVSGIN